MRASTRPIAIEGQRRLQKADRELRDGSFSWPPAKAVALRSDNEVATLDLDTLNNEMHRVTAIARMIDGYLAVEGDVGAARDRILRDIERSAAPAHALLLVVLRSLEHCMF